MTPLPEPQPDKSQLGLFAADPSGDGATEAAGELQGDHSADAEGLAHAVMAAASLQGVGFQTVRKLYDAGALSYLLARDHERFTASLGEAVGESRRSTVSPTAVDLDRALDAGAAQLHRLTTDHGVLVTDRHPGYPDRLRQLPDPPRWIFVLGDIDVLRSPSMVSIVGTRKPSPEGLRLAFDAGRTLAAQALVVLSGLARGIDEQAHSGATRVMGRTVGVLGHGLSLDRSNKQEHLVTDMLTYGGAVVSEYLPTDPPSSQNFLRRNELVAALARVVVPIECPDLNSGTGATIRRALRVKTPVIGIQSKKLTSPSLEATGKNLRSLDLDVYTVHNGDTERLWTFLRNAIPEHRWSKDPRRRDFFYTWLLDYIASENREALLDLDEDDVDALAEALKARLRLPRRGVL